MAIMSTMLLTWAKRCGRGEAITNPVRPPLRITVVEAEDLVGGRYRLLEVIGAGGMGRVWLAADVLLGRQVAIKEISTPAEATVSLDMQVATMREARAAARLDHPGVVHVYDVIWRPGTSWIVMEYIPSRSLHDAAPLSHREAARVGLGLLAALRAAHRAGVLHRDVKPHNVLLADDGRVVLSDFGLASVEGAGPEPSLGTPQYLAPERVRGDEAGPAADLWSLGATLYAAVEGRSPFARETIFGSLSAVLNEPPDPPARRGALTPAIDALLVKDPAVRLTAEQLEPMLRRASDRVMGIFPVHPLPGGAAKERIARSTRSTLAVAAVLFVGTTGSALLLDSTSSSSPAPPAALPAAVDCADQAAGSVLTASQGDQRYALPSGWIWHHDPGGFQLALPQGWTRRADGEVACFRDPGGGRSFQVMANGPIVDDAVGHWAQAEQSALADGALPGYQRIGMAPLELKDGGADWEYTWQPEPGMRRHERRLLLSMGPDRAYVMDWTSGDPDWATSEPILQLIVASLT